jgi:predicted TIM-barrel fold metal-dependent hydrolase
VFQTWKPAIAEVATCRNVHAKLGGLGMGYLTGFGWEKRPKPPTSDELLAVNRRWFEHTIEVFGPDRCMFQSNFPPDKESSSYTVLWNHFKKLTKSFSKSERAAMFHDTAMRVYRLSRLAACHHYSRSKSLLPLAKRLRQVRSSIFSQSTLVVERNS